MGRWSRLVGEMFLDWLNCSLRPCRPGIRFVVQSAGDFDADIHHAGEFHGSRA